MQRFVDASIIGWYNYLYGDNTAANDLIKKDNPEMTDDQIAYSIAKMKEYGILISGEAETKGIGCMTDARWKEFYDKVGQDRPLSGGPRLHQGLHDQVRLQGRRHGPREVSGLTQPHYRAK